MKSTFVSINLEVPQFLLFLKTVTEHSKGFLKAPCNGGLGCVASRNVLVAQSLVRKPLLH